MLRVLGVSGTFTTTWKAAAKVQIGQQKLPVPNKANLKPVRCHTAGSRGMLLCAQCLNASVPTVLSMPDGMPYDRQSASGSPHRTVRQSAPGQARSAHSVASPCCGLRSRSASDSRKGFEHEQKAGTSLPPLACQQLPR